MPRWERLCQDCWQAIEPEAYLPADSVDWDECETCGQLSMLYAHIPAHTTAEGA